MPSLSHEALPLLFRNCPELAPQLMRESLGVKLPEYSVIHEQSTDFTEALPTEYRADLVVQLADDRGPVMGLVVEVQLRRDPQKRYTWPVYVTNLRARLQCDALLLVVTPFEHVAAWCRERISLGGGSFVQPWVVGPEAVPRRLVSNAPVGSLAAAGHSPPSPHARKCFSISSVRGRDDWPTGAARSSVRV